jgi:hypothetical protein
VHGYEPIPEGQFRAVHHSAAAQGGAETALLALVLPLVAFPVVVFATTMGTYHSFFVPDRFELELAALLVWIYLVEI